MVANWAAPTAVQTAEMMAVRLVERWAAELVDGMAVKWAVSTEYLRAAR